MKRILKNTRFQLIIIALCLLLTTTALCLSAYLTDMKSIGSTFRTASGDEFGIELSGTEYTDQTVLPGDTIQISPTITNSGDYGAYVFVETSLTDGMSVDMDSFDDTWSQLSDGVYYYGANGTVAEVAADVNTSPFENIVYSAAATDKEGTSLEVTITAYAVQSTNITDTNASSVWALAKGE